jgi:hypothetical protein
MAGRKPGIASVKQLEEEFGLRIPDGDDDKVVSLTIRLKESRRAYWNAQAKLQRATITAAILQALEKRFGLPE